MTYEIFVKMEFSAAHYLRNYPGNCERLHGHNWGVEVAVRTARLDSIDVGIDFRDLKKAVSQVIDELDHKNLNEIDEFRERNPSSELIAVHIFRKVRDALAHRPDVCVSRVTVSETPRSGVTYWE